MPAESPQTVELVQGLEAQNKLSLLLDRAFDDDAVGGVYGYKLTAFGPEMVNIENPAEAEVSAMSRDYTLIIIDSGNSAGDMWKYVYHPSCQAGMLVIEQSA